MINDFPTHNQPAYSVSEISTSIKRLVEDTFGNIRVRGEISGLKVAASGHAYLALKDENAILDAVCWKGNVQRLPFKPEDGVEVICTGKLTTYPGRSKYQLVIDRMEVAGQGALMALLEKRRQQLAAEGLFDEKRKKKLPFMPQTIGVITSPTGAVIRDILHRIADRFPVHVLVWPVAVQGEGAAEQIAAAINGFNQLAERTEGKEARSVDRVSPQHAERHSMEFSVENSGSRIKPDLLIVARGGGSLEDLWAFNEEIVVRAAAASRSPIISAVGHETDTTLIDFAADVRAPTPTAAAEMAVPVRGEWWLTCLDYGKRLTAGAMRALLQREEIIISLARGLPRPVQLLEHAMQRLDDWAERLAASLPSLLQAKSQALAVVVASLKPNALQKDIAREADRLKDNGVRLRGAYARYVQLQEQRLQISLQLLETLNYTRVLARGFALVKDEAGRVVTARAQVVAGDALTVLLKDGEFKVRAE